MSFLNEERKYLSSSLLDSSLITATIPKISYDIKMIKCGDYTQFYVYSKSNTRQCDNWDIPKKKIYIDKLNKFFNIYKRFLDMPFLNTNNTLLLSNYIYKYNYKLIFNQFVCNNVFLYLKRYYYYIYISTLNNIEDNIYSLDTKIDKISTLKQIEKRNIIRSNNCMCRLVLSNENIFKSFITLTFNQDIVDINQANYEFKKLITKIKRVFPTLAYVAVPEFQKNDRIHYHLLTNINYDDDILINENIYINELYHKIKIMKSFKLYKTCQYSNFKMKYNKLNQFNVCLRYENGILQNTKKTFSKKNNTIKIFKTLKYWNCGYSNIISISGNINNISRYMAKYMIKDCDNRLYGYRRYLYSRNLKRPKITYLNSDLSSDNWLFNSIINIDDILYQNDYMSKFGDNVSFIELKDKDKCNNI